VENTIKITDVRRENCFKAFIVDGLADSGSINGID
jgi:hypothetical protein